MGPFKKEAILNILLLVSPFLIAGIFTYISLAQNRKEINSAFKEMRLIERSLENFKKDIGRYPDVNEGLRALLKNPGLASWQKPYIEKSQFVDPWGEQYKYGDRSINNKHGFFIGSSGKNKKWETAELDIKNRRPSGDDIIIWLEEK